MKRCVAMFFALILMLSVSSIKLWADEKASDTKATTWQELFSDVVGHYPLSIDQTNTAQVERGKLNQPKNWVFDLGLQDFLMSHTSYQFGNSAAPYQKPISKLEFPINTWWLEAELRRTCPRWSAGIRAGLSVAKNVDGRFKDSDWLNPGNTSMLTTYSESAMREENSYLFRADTDVNISDWLGLPPSFEIRPLFAFEFQRLNVMAHDGVQWEVGSYSPDGNGSLDNYASAQALAGNSIQFHQDYYMYQIGLRGVYDGFKIGKYIAIKVKGEPDWGPVLGYSEDNHLLRDLFGYIRSTGNSFYFSTGLDMVFAKTITAGVSMDYLCIRSFGIQHDRDLGHGGVEGWDDYGVRVWSDQTSLTAHVSYAF